MKSSEAGTDYTSVINSLKVRIDNLAPRYQMEVSKNETEASFENFLMLLDCLFYTDISKAYMQSKCPDPKIVNQIVANYLYRHNHFEAGDVFIREASVPEASTFRSQYKEMHEILRSLKKHNVAPAIDWIYKNNDHPELIDPRLQFELYRQQYFEALKSGIDPIQVLNFLRRYLTPFDSFYWDEVKSLAGCMLWIGRLDESPYADLLSSAKWNTLANDFTEKFLGLLGQSIKCPLTTVCNAGAQNLPLLLSLRKTAGDKEQWESIKSLPCQETDSGDGCNFHSVFVCRQCRETATNENPPTLLPCGHTLCWDSVTRLSCAGSLLFQCPFCSHEIHLHQCVLLFL